MPSFRPVLAAALVACAVPLPGGASAACVDPYVCYSPSDRTLVVYPCVDGACEPAQFPVDQMSRDLRAWLQQFARDFNARVAEAVADARDLIPEPSPGVPQP